MKYQPEFTWDEENKTATCVLTDDSGRIFIGEATCHPTDYDMSSERTGCELAFHRAKIQYLRAVRDNELKPALKALKHLYGSMTHSTHFEAKSYEARTMRKHIYQTTFDLTTIKEEIAYEYQWITDYIKGKERLYKSIRAKRSQDQNN